MRGICEKPRSDAGQPFVAGVYPLLQDEMCWFLAIDFDKSNWQHDATAFLETCARMHVNAALERSRSGRGGHVWLFFEEAVPAALARRLGSHLLTETMEQRPDLGFDSYDRLFPSQDTLPQGGFGNLIALPLQKASRDKGNSVFLDERLIPWTDQWAFLAGLHRMDRVQAERVVQVAERRGRILSVRLPPQEDGDDEPWTAPPSRRSREPVLTGELPTSIDLVLGNQIQDTLSNLGIRVTVRDERNAGQRLQAAFRGNLRAEQQSVADAMLAQDNGVLAATTAFGKTVVAAWLIAQRGVNTLVLVHRRQLLDQWIERLSTFLDLPPSSIGRIGGGRTRPTGQVDVAVIQSLVKKGVVDDRVGEYGHLIVDECHHLSAQSFERVARQAKARFVTGLSATIARKDGHHPIILMQCGPVRYRVDAKAQAATRPFEHVVLVQPTSFRPLSAPDTDKRAEFQTLYQELVDDEQRNRRITDDVVDAVRAGRSPLVLTERNEHMDRLEQMLAPKVSHLVVLRAGMGKKKRQIVADRLAAIPSDEPRVLLATGKYIGEGFDDARLDTLFLTLPVSWRGTVAQYAGRLHRLHDGKREVRIYDYADLDVRMLARMFDRRCRGYEAIGYTLLLPASAIPGWPAAVPLPSQPLWKRDYAASVRRLVRDGVDAPLATLFVHVAQPVPPDAEGAERARSATERFLFQRLQTLPETRNRFRLNADLPIAFDSLGRLEVDLLCADARVAVELDGAQHLADPIAYRRDRRKDQVLQENGYLVLRFLAEDAGKELDLVLDSILRAISHRTPAPPKLLTIVNRPGGVTSDLCTSH